MFDLEDVVVKARDPLFSFCRQFEVFECGPDIGDLTGLFWTKGSVRNCLGKELGHAEEKV